MVSVKKEKTSYKVGFEVLAAVIMKSTIFWDITSPSNPVLSHEVCGVLLGFVYSHAIVRKKARC
jgi:hypothetical protein